MKNLSRRSAVKEGVAGAAAMYATALGGTASGDEPKAAKLWTMEGELKVHPKFIYRYYLVLLDGQKCALYGTDHDRETDQLARLKPPVRMRVRGVLGTEHHPGGTKDDPSPFPEGWTVYMDVHETDVLK